MSVSPDFIETEIQKMLDIIELQCEKFGIVDTPSPKKVKKGIKKLEDKVDNVNREDA